jgi:multidrug resistance efflux pump
MQAALSTAQAEKNGNEIAVEDVRTKLRRATELGAHQLIPQVDLDAAQIAMDEAIANLQSATSLTWTRSVRGPTSVNEDQNASSADSEHASICRATDLANGSREPRPRARAQTR